MNGEPIPGAGGAGANEITAPNPQPLETGNAVPAVVTPEVSALPEITSTPAWLGEAFTKVTEIRKNGLSETQLQTLRENKRKKEKNDVAELTPREIEYAVNRAGLKAVRDVIRKGGHLNEGVQFLKSGGMPVGMEGDIARSAIINMDIERVDAAKRAADKAGITLAEPAIDAVTDVTSITTTEQPVAAPIMDVVSITPPEISTPAKTTEDQAHKRAVIRKHEKVHPVPPQQRSLVDMIALAGNAGRDGASVVMGASVAPDAGITPAAANTTPAEQQPNPNSPFTPLSETLSVTPQAHNVLAMDTDRKLSEKEYTQKLTNMATVEDMNVDNTKRKQFDTVSPSVSTTWETARQEKIAQVARTWEEARQAWEDSLPSPESAETSSKITVMTEWLKEKRKGAAKVAAAAGIALSLSLGSGTPKDVAAPVGAQDIATPQATPTLEATPTAPPELVALIEKMSSSGKVVKVDEEGESYSKAMQSETGKYHLEPEEFSQKIYNTELLAALALVNPLLTLESHPEIPLEQKLDILKRASTGDQAAIAELQPIADQIIKGRNARIYTPEELTALSPDLFAALNNGEFSDIDALRTAFAAQVADETVAQQSANGNNDITRNLLGGAVAVAGLAGAAAAGARKKGWI